MKIYIKENKTEIFLFLFLSLTLLIECALFNSKGYSVAILFVMLIIIVALFLNIEKGFFLIAFCLPFSSVLKLGENSITVLPILYSIIILKSFFQAKFSIDSKFLISIFIFALLQVVSCLLYNAPLTSMISFLFSIVFVFFFSNYFVKQDWKDGYLIKNATLFFSGAVVLETLFADLFEQIPYFINAEKHNAMVVAERFAALNIDPNEYAQLVLIAIGLIIAIIPLLKKNAIKLFCFAFVLFLAYKGFLTNSKSYALTIIMLFAILLFIYLINYIKKHGVSGLYIIIPLAIILVIGGYFLYKNILIPIFENRKGDDILTGRGELWVEYLTTLTVRIDCLLLGCGTSNTLYLGSNVHHVPHNLYIEYVVQYGLVGLFLLSGILKISLKCILAKLKTYIGIVICAFAITAFGISANASDVIFFVLIVACVPYLKTKNRGL